MQLNQDPEGLGKPAIGTQDLRVYPSAVRAGQDGQRQRCLSLGLIVLAEEVF